MTSQEEIPVRKIGAVILRWHRGSHDAQDAAGEGDRIEALVVRPKPSHDDGSLPNLTLPRGSRQYATHDAEGDLIWKDARDDDAAIANAQRLESYTRALARELEEETGFRRSDLLRQKEIYELGVRDYHSPRGDAYPVQWYVIWPDDKALSHMEEAIPQDVTERRWCTLDELGDMADPKHQLFSTGYHDVVSEAIEKSLYKQLPRVTIRGEQIER